MRLRHDPTKALPLVALVVASVSLVWFGRRAATEDPPDRTAAGALVFEYLHALEHQSPGRLVELALGTDAGESEVDVDVDDRLRRFGGASASRATVEIGPTPAPELLAVTIKTIGLDGQALSWTERVVWRRGAWRLVRGSVRDLPSDEAGPSADRSP